MAGIARIAPFHQLCGWWLLLHLAALTAASSTPPTGAAADPGRPVDWHAVNRLHPPDVIAVEDVMQAARGRKAARAFPCAGDSDCDGLGDTYETGLGLDPENIDSDCDAIDDGTEVGGGAPPSDSDGDGLIDALESQYVDSDLDGIVDQDDPTTGWQPSCGRFLPFAVTSGQSTRLEVTVAGDTSASKVVVDATSFLGDVLVDGVPVPTAGGIELFDDGSHDDRMAGDGIWTRDNITSSAVVSGLLPVERSFDLVQVTDATGTTTRDLDEVVGYRGRFVVGIANPSLVEPPSMPAPNLQVTSHLVNLIDPIGALDVRRFVSLLGTYDLQTIAQTFYSVLDDDYDFLYLVPDARNPQGAAGVHITIRNDVSGINLSLFDHSAFFGSAGKLQGLNAQSWGVGGPVVHEILHQWAAYLREPFGFGQCTGSHWGVSGGGRGVLGGFDPATLIDNGDGTYTVGAFGTSGNAADNLSMIELYVAGLASAAEIPDSLNPQNVDCGSLFVDWVADTATFGASHVAVVMIDDVIAEYGPRVPDSTTSQKAFKMAFVVVSQYELDTSEMAFFNGQSMLFSNPSGEGFFKSFSEATLGRATLDTTITITTGLVFEDGFESGQTSAWSQVVP